VKYVDGKVHTNGPANFWSLLKGGLSGTYVSVEPFHLFRYLDEQTFRHNYRKEMDNYDRFELALSQITGKRLTYQHLTGKDREPDTAGIESARIEGTEKLLAFSGGWFLGLFDRLFERVRCCRFGY
jgi:hypothetical protein